MQPKISVIVPVYKAEKYLHRCVDSILSQTFTDFELILVDDGSPDNSGVICDEYAVKDMRVKVLHKNNGGVSSARNVGLDSAQGEWLLFLDADDWLSCNTFDECLRIGDNCDIIRFGYNSVFDENGDITKKRLPDVAALKDYLRLVIERKTTMAIWGAMYKRSIFKLNKIYFDTTIRMGEDWVVLVNVILHSKNIKFLSLPLYQYNRYNEESCVNNFSFGKQLEMVKAYAMIVNILESKELTWDFGKSLQISYLTILNDIISLHLVSSVNVDLFLERRKQIQNISALPSLIGVIKSSVSIRNKLQLLLCLKGCLGYRLLLSLKKRKI